MTEKAYRRFLLLTGLALILASLILGTAVLGATPTVAAEDVAAVHAGQSRARVENTLGSHGHRTGMVATDVRRILTKSYPAADGGRYVLTFWGPLCDCGPYAGPYRLHSKRQVIP